MLKQEFLVCSLIVIKDNLSSQLIFSYQRLWNYEHLSIYFINIYLGE